MITRAKLFNSFIGLFISLGVTIYALNIYSKYIEQPFLSYKNLPFPITATAYPGDIVTFLVVRCNSSSSVQQLVSTRALVPEDATMKTIAFEYVFVNAIPGCTPPVPLVNIIPLDTPPGFYRYIGRSKVNGILSEHLVNWNTDIVQVLKRPG